MRYLLIILVLVGLLTSQGCKHEPAVGKTDENTRYLSQQMMDYFVNYEVGTQWIYQDTIDPMNYDTIELVSKENFNMIGANGVVDSKGYELYYKPKKAKDFSVNIQPGNNKKYYVQIYKKPHEAGFGYIGFENHSGKWISYITEKDTLIISGNTYFNTINSNSGNGYYSNYTISKSKGLVRYYYEDISDLGNRNRFGGHFKLINTIKP